MKDEEIKLFLAYLNDEDKLAYSKAVEGDAEAQVRMGIVAESAGLYDYAVSWNRKAVAQGYIRAYIELGIILSDYFNGDKEAVDLYLHAAKYGNEEEQKDAIFELYLCYKDSGYLDKTDLVKIAKGLAELEHNGSHNIFFNIKFT